MRKMQSNQAQGRSGGNLFKPQAQTETGLGDPSCMIEEGIYFLRYTDRGILLKEV